MVGEEGQVSERAGGFREKRSTDQIFILKEVVGEESEKEYLLLFLNIRKAYDTVFREGLWRVVKNLYSEVGSCVRLGEEKTEWFKLEVGLRQGCILSPALFSIFIDGIAEVVKKVGGARYGELVLR